MSEPATPPPAPLHALLKRQLRRLGLTPEAPPGGEAWSDLLRAVGRAYREHEQDRYLLERAQAISSEELTQQAEMLRLNQERLASLLQLSSDWVWEQDADLRVTYMSEGWQTVTGIPASSVVGTLRLHLDDFDASDEVKAEFRTRLARREPFRDLTVGIETLRGMRYMRLSGEPLVDAQGRFRGYRGVGRDATEATLATHRAEHMAHFDALTGLANRHALTQSLHRALQQARWRGTRVAVAFIDLDGFKAVNDHLGHTVGDELLREMGHRLHAAARTEDLVARLGGDEFVVVVERAGDNQALSGLAARLLETIGAPVRLHERQFRLNASIGISVFPDDGDDAVALLRHADAAMYAAKARGEGVVHFYTAELAAEAAETFTLETELREAVTRGQLVLHYQPKFRVADGALTGVEALVRWQHPARGLLLPGSFVPMAERRGLIVAIGRLVLAEACRQMRAWRDAGLVVPRCAVNLSAHHFNAEGVAAEIESALQQAGLEPAALEIELTESAIMTDPERAHRIMSRLQALGVSIAIDDFGTGHSSLAYLKRFPVSTLKIDRSFVGGLPADANDSAITQAVVAMARSLGMNTVAEGVETPEQLAYLAGIGCCEVQGFLLGRPQPASRLTLDAVPRLAAAPATPPADPTVVALPATRATKFFG